MTTTKKTTEEDAEKSAKTSAPPKLVKCRVVVEKLETSLGYASRGQIIEITEANANLYGGAVTKISYTS